MKKLFTFVLALILVIYPVTLNANAQTENGVVYVTYNPGSAAVNVVNFTVEWGSMEFSYNAAVGGTWDPTTHTYTGQTPASWTCESGANEITVTNHSSTELEVSFAYYATADYESVVGTFDNSSATLDSAVGKATSQAPSLTTTLTLSGEINPSTLSEDSLEYVDIYGKHIVGNVVVTINS